jgi:alpha-tubulin suppressor-like RCC1 family protein
MRLRPYAVPLLLALISGGLAGGVLVSPATSSAALTLRAATASCADVLLVGAAGSGEGPSAALPFGRTAGVFRARFLAEAAAEGRTVESRYAGVRTAAVGTLRARPPADGDVTRVVTARSVKAWEGDLGDATAKLVKALVARAGTCPQQEIVLVGYAQGAMAVHRALLRLPRYPGIFKRVVAAALIADGDRVGGTRAVLAGDPMAPRRAHGLQQWARTPVADVPASGWTVPVSSVCTRADLACHVTHSSFSAAAAVHRGYVGGVAAGVVRTVAGRIFARATRWAVPAHDPAPVIAAQGVALSQQLPVLVASGDREHVVFAGATGLPPGLALDGDGVLSGTPTASGIYTVHFTVTNTASAVFDRPVAGTIQVRVLNQAPRTVSAGGEHTCSVRFDGTLWCWGRNTWGALGNDDRGPGRSSPLQIGSDTNWATVAAGGGHTCATRAGTLWCWGLNNKGQLGDGTTDVKTLPERIGTGTGWAQLSADWFHTCGVRTTGTAACWGENSAGQLGDGTRVQRLRPTPVAGDDWASIAVGGWTTCGIRTDHTLWCWGRNDFGQLGDGTTANRDTPTQIGVGKDWAQVSVGWSHTCGVKTTGKLRCWGRGDRGQLGDGAFAQRTEPVEPSGGLPATQVVVGDAHTCALTTDNETWCWGSGDYGQLGTGTGDSSGVPVRAQGSFSSLSAGWMHTCGITLTGPLDCWGNNERGQLGDGTQEDTVTPSTTVPPAPPVDGTAHFTLGTFNLLGDIHTAPYKDSDFRAPSRIRDEWQADGLRQLGLPDIFGTQESTETQFQGLMRATDNAYAAFPGAMNDYKAVMTSIFWLKSRWTLVAKETFQVPYIKWPKPRPAVRLRNNATGQEIWVINVHNAPLDNQTMRDAAVKVEIEKIQEKMKDGIPVFFTGDMNEGKTVLCKILLQTDLYSPRGGSVQDGTCVPPSGHLRVDWIFGSKRIGDGPGVLFDAYHEWRTTLIGRSSDHHLLMTGVTLPTG